MTAPATGGDSETQALLIELARVKALFQQRAILLHMGVNPDASPDQPKHEEVR